MLLETVKTSFFSPVKLKAKPRMAIGLVNISATTAKYTYIVLDVATLQCCNYITFRWRTWLSVLVSCERWQCQLWVSEGSPWCVAAAALGRGRVLPVHMCVPVSGSHSQPQHGLPLQPGQRHRQKQPWTDTLQPGLQQPSRRSSWG